VVEALVHPVGDRTVGEERGEHLVDRSQHRCLAAHVEEGLLLTGKGSLRQVFGGRGRAHRDRELRSPLAQLAQCREHRRVERRRQRHLENPLADARAARGERVDIIDIESRQLAADACVEAPLREELAIGVCGGGEAARYLNAELRQRADHLPERGILAADTLEVAHAELLEGNDVGVHESSRWSVTRRRALATAARTVEHCGPEA